jgi:aryl-alcohol dehydrogenase-like predicted oxidoreductase
VKYNRLGQTGVTVSALALGTATFGVAPLEGEVDRLLGRALDLGVNVIDTANTYGNQPRFDRPGAPPAQDRLSSEEMIGKALGARRHNIVLCSKVMEPVGKGPNDRGLSRRHVMQQVEESLRRLRTDHLDIYYAHHPDPATPLAETVGVFDDLIQQGKIRYWALSTYPASQIVEALWKADVAGARPPVCVQIQYSLAVREPEKDLIPACLAHGVSTTVFGPLAGGLLAGSAKTREATGHKRWGGPGYTQAQLEVAAALEALAREAGYAPAALALSWMLSKPSVASAVIGPETLAELEQNVAIADLSPPADLLAAVDLIGKPVVSPWG